MYSIFCKHLLAVYPLILDALLAYSLVKYMIQFLSKERSTVIFPFHIKSQTDEEGIENYQIAYGYFQYAKQLLAKREFSKQVQRTLMRQYQTNFKYIIDRAYFSACIVLE